MALSLSQKGGGLHVKLEVSGETQVKAVLTGVLKRVKDFRPLANPIDFVLRRSVTYMFENEGGKRAKWDELQELTVKDRIRKGFPGAHPILVRTGRLRDSFIQKSHREHILVKDKKYIEFGSKTPYAAYSQDPGRRYRRPMVYVDKDDVNDMIRFIRMFIVDNKVFSK